MSENWMLRSVLFVRKFVKKAHESSFPLGNEIQVAQPVFRGPRGTKWGLHNLYFDWASSSRATDNVGYIAVMAIDLCQARGGLSTSNRARAHDLGNQKLQNYVIALLKRVCCMAAACICSTHMNLWKQGIFGNDLVRKLIFVLEENGTNCQF